MAARSLLDSNPELAFWGYGLLCFLIGLLCGFILWRLGARS